MRSPLAIGDRVAGVVVEEIIDNDPWLQRVVARSGEHVPPVQVVRVHLGEFEGKLPLLHEIVGEVGLFMRAEHPSLARIHAVSVDEPDSVIVVSELLRGETLKGQQQASQWQTPAAALLGAEGMARALHCVHSQQDDAGRSLGLLFRDLHPDRIVITPGGRWVLREAFPLVSLYTRSGVNSQRAAMRYMSPEQIMGESLDVRSDVYTLGVMLYEALLGGAPRPVFSNVVDELKAALDAEVTPLDALPPALDPVRRVLAGLLVKDRGQRAFADALTLADALAAARAELAGDPVQLPESEPPAREEHDRLLDKWRSPGSGD